MRPEAPWLSKSLKPHLGNPALPCPHQARLLPFELLCRLPPDKSGRIPDAGRQMLRHRLRRSRVHCARGMTGTAMSHRLGGPPTRRGCRSHGAPVSLSICASRIAGYQRSHGSPPGPEASRGRRPPRALYHGQNRCRRPDERAPRQIQLIEPWSRSC